MIFVSDVHDSPGALARLVELDEEIVILGDLVNLTDYRTGEGAVASVLGAEFASRSSAARAKGAYAEMRSLWQQRSADSVEDLRQLIGEELADQYRRAGIALRGGHGYVIHGNVDRPGPLRKNLPSGFRYVHGDVVEHDGLRLGFVGGGVSTPLRADGEVSDEEMETILGSIGSVDILCTHVAPAIPSLRRDVVTGREERGSDQVRTYLERHQPRFHLYGDVHQPQASTWRLGHTRCFNAGYFRATGRFLRLERGDVHIQALSVHRHKHGDASATP